MLPLLEDILIMRTAYIFSVEIGKILEHPYTRGSTPGETEARVDILEITHMARSTGEITDEFVVGRKEIPLF